MVYRTYLFATLGAVIALLFVFRMFIYHINNQRLAITIASSYTTTALHFYSLPPASWFSVLRRYSILPPLHKLRHNNPVIVGLSTPSIKIHLGALPTRLNFIIIFLYLLSNILYCTLYLPWEVLVGPRGRLREPTKAALVAEFRGRTGVMAVVNRFHYLFAWRETISLGSQLRWDLIFGTCFTTGLAGLWYWSR